MTLLPFSWEAPGGEPHVAARVLRRTQRPSTEGVGAGVEGIALEAGDAGGAS